MTDTTNPTGLAEEAWREFAARVPAHHSPVNFMEWLFTSGFLAAQARHEAEVDKHEREIGEAIDERDAAQEALSQAYFLIVGRSPEWSNLFGIEQALEDIDDTQSILRETAKTVAVGLQAEVAELVEGLRPFAEAAEHLHPSQPDDGVTLDGLMCSDFRRAYGLVSAHDAKRAEE